MLVMELLGQISLTRATYLIVPSPGFTPSPAKNSAQNARKYSGQLFLNEKAAYVFGVSITYRKKGDYG